MSSGRWQAAQFLKRIGATSLLKVIGLFAGSLLFALMIGAVNRQIAAKTKNAIANTSLLIIAFTSSFPFRRCIYLNKINHSKWRQLLECGSKQPHSKSCRRFMRALRLLDV